MPLSPKRLEVKFEGCSFGVSARRIYEHMTLGQINPFQRSVSSVRSLHDAAELIDLVHFDAPKRFSLIGLTLAGLDDGVLSTRTLGRSLNTARHAAAQGAIRELVADVDAAAKRHSMRRAARNVPSRFLADPAISDPFGVPSLRSRLCDYLATQAQARMGAAQWLGTIRNLANKGLRNEELQRSGLLDLLEAMDADAHLTGEGLQQAVDFSALRLSVIANITEARTQLRFEVVSDRPLAKIKGEARPQTAQQRQLHLFDRALGYRIEEVEHAALWGQDRHWQAVTFDGKVLRNRVTRRAIFESSAEAISRAQEHAREILPRLLASERWVDWSWTGGEEYREWLITMPYFLKTYFSSHFGARNVLAHVRCDLREGADGEKILMLHELQSDWMQGVRRRIARDPGTAAALEELSPFLREWPALTLKLMLLHAAHSGVDALGWTRGAQQAHRYGGLGEEGLRQLYDRILPREATRMLKPFGIACDTVEVFVPDNFKIRRCETGYEVRTAQGRLLGIAASFGEARALLPDGAHERLHPVHGVRFSKATREAILAKGFAAWG